MSVNWDLQRGLGRWIAALLVLVAAIHATLPDGPALERNPGSAFSATTSDVAVACSVRVESVRQALPDRSRPPLSACPPMAAFAEPIAAALEVPHQRRARAPPLAHVALRPFGPRAPPLV